MTDEVIIAQTKKWITDVVVGCNFCPFAGREVKRGSIHYVVVNSRDLKIILETVAQTLSLLDQDPAIETALIILPQGFTLFQAYLNLADTAESLLEKEGYEGTYQLATFHPTYLFAGSREDDPANYTNRSPYPMLHLLRESSITKAADNYPGLKDIPEKNIAFASGKGLQYMQLLKEACMRI